MDFDIWRGEPGKGKPITTVETAMKAMELLNHDTVAPGAEADVAGLLCFTPHGEIYPMFRATDGMERVRYWEDATMAEVLMWCHLQVLPLLSSPSALAAPPDLDEVQLYLLDQFASLVALYQDQDGRLQSVCQDAGLNYSEVEMLTNLCTEIEAQRDPAETQVLVRAHIAIDRLSKG